MIVAVIGIVITAIILPRVRTSVTSQFLLFFVNVDLLPFNMRMAVRPLLVAAGLISARTAPVLSTVTVAHCDYLSIPPAEK